MVLQFAGSAIRLGPFSISLVLILIVLGAAIFWFMAWAQSWLIAYQDRPLLSAGIQIVLGLAAIAIYVGYGRFVERRRVTELSLPGLGREWAAGALLGAALYSACAVVLMLLGVYRVEGVNPVTFLLPAVGAGGRAPLPAMSAYPPSRQR